MTDDETEEPNPNHRSTTSIDTNTTTGKAVLVAGGVATGIAICNPLTIVAAGCLAAATVGSGRSSGNGSGRSVIRNDPSGSSESHDTTSDDDTNTTTNTNTNTTHKQPQIGGAAAIGSIIGLTLTGPTTALLAGTTAATLALTDSGQTGDAIRASGDLAVTVHSKAKDLDRKHRIVGTTVDVLGRVVTKVVEFDARHKVMDRAVTGMVLVLRTVVYRSLYLHHETEQVEQRTIINEQQQITTSEHKRRIGGAAVAGTIAGLAMFGPAAGALFTGAAVAGLARVNQGVVGDAARKSGDMVVAAHGQWKGVDEEHRILERGGRMMNGVVKRARVMGGRVVNRVRGSGGGSGSGSGSGSGGGWNLEEDDGERPPPYNPEYRNTIFREMQPRLY